MDEQYEKYGQDEPQGYLDGHGPYGPQDPPSPSHCVMGLFLRLARQQRALIAGRLRETGVYQSQHQTLMDIAFHPDASQKDIARRQEVSTATTAVTLKKLERAGYIRRVMDETDNRYNRLQITEKGQKIVCQSHKILHRTEEEMFAGFTEGDFRQLETLLERVCQNIEQMSAEDGRQAVQRPITGQEPGDAGRPGKRLRKIEKVRDPHEAV